jgi:hypothetical protein
MGQPDLVAGVMVSVGPTPGIGMPVNYRVVIVLIAAIVLLLTVAINVTTATRRAGRPL